MNNWKIVCDKVSTTMDLSEMEFEKGVATLILSFLGWNEFRGNIKEQYLIEDHAKGYTPDFALFPYGEDMPFNEASVDVAKNLPGTGLYERHDKFYFTQEQYSADGSMCSQLYFMTSKETYVMGIHIWYWEFLWDSMEGDPMFALLVRQMGDSKQEFRFYFENGKVIKVVPEVKKWPSIDDDLSIAPFKSPADVLSLMNAKQELFKTLVNE